MASNKYIPGRDENESVMAYIRRIAAAFPKMPMIKIREAATQTLRTRVSSYKPHYGNQAAARNLRHAKAFTHGLYYFYNKIQFG